jgi:hypothetical protein
MTNCLELARPMVPFSICVASIGDDLQVERIADLDWRRPSPDQGLAILEATFMQASTIMSRRRAY